jgi:hypothetical protein
VKGNKMKTETKGFANTQFLSADDYEFSFSITSIPQIEEEDPFYVIQLTLLNIENDEMIQLDDSMYCPDILSCFAKMHALAATGFFGGFSQTTHVILLDEELSWMDDLFFEINEDSPAKVEQMIKDKRENHAFRSEFKNNANKT